MTAVMNVSERNIGTKMKILGRLFQMRQIELAEAIGIQKGTINSWLCGRSTPSRPNLKKFAQAFAVRIDWFHRKAPWLVGREKSILDNATHGTLPDEEKFMFSTESISAFIRNSDLPIDLKARVATRLKELLTSPLREQVPLDVVGEPAAIREAPIDPQQEKVARLIERTMKMIPDDALKVAVETWLKDIVGRCFDIQRSGK